MKKNCLFFMIILLVSCSKKIKNTKSQILINHLERNLSTKYEKDELYLFLNTTGCGYCFKYTKEFLIKKVKQNKKVNLIMVGEFKKELLLLSKGLQEKFTLIFDYNEIFLENDSLKEDSFILIDEGLSETTVVPFSVDNNFEKMKQVLINFTELN
tara:strand:+ start:3312 stop:3776 length:465 start_codon:yes stop_codon:yes gene_type:complete